MISTYRDSEERKEMKEEGGKDGSKREMTTFSVIRIRGLQPPSANVYYRNFHGRMVLSKEGRAFRDVVKAKCSGCKKILGTVTIAIIFRFKDQRRRDLDNYFKAVIDATKDILFEDDCMVEQIHSKKLTGCSSDFGFDMIVLPSSSSSL